MDDIVVIFSRMDLMVSVVRPQIRSFLMCTMLKEVPGSASECLRLDRTDIDFFNVTPETVRIEVTLRNAGPVRTKPAELPLEVAPFGAFLPWSPLTTLHVPPIDPGEALLVEAEVPVAPVRPIGNLFTTPPGRLLTALGLSGEDEGSKDVPRSASPLRSFLEADSPDRTPRSGENPAHGLLPADPLALLGRAGAHWAGNINVFAGSHAVERHKARALRIYPGRPNAVMFIVGGPEMDAYSFTLEGEGASWDCSLFRAPLDGPFTVDFSDCRVIEPGRWYPARLMAIYYLMMRPQMDAERGSVEVHVQQASTLKSACVEFSLDAEAQGPGCFTI
ncbi:MAG: hypothetical protein ABIK65_13325 [Candidatus Eisenbacteria bacterium]